MNGTIYRLWEIGLVTVEEEPWEDIPMLTDDQRIGGKYIETISHITKTDGI